MAISSGIRVAHDAVFPQTCFMKGEVRKSEDFDKRSAGLEDTQARDKVTGLRLWEVTVLDTDPDARKGQSEATVKIAAEVQPVPPPEQPGLGLRPVIFEGLTVTPYVDMNAQRPRVAYAFRATGMRAPGRAQDAGQAASKPSEQAKAA